jgi:hypothetical protein
MDRYVIWFARLGRFYQVIMTSALFIGIAAIAVGAGTQSTLFMLAGFFWVVGGSAVVWVADRRERA